MVCRRICWLICFGEGAVRGCWWWFLMVDSWRSLASLLEMECVSFNQTEKKNDRGKKKIEKTMSIFSEFNLDLHIFSPSSLKISWNIIEFMGNYIFGTFVYFLTYFCPQDICSFRVLVFYLNSLFFFTHSELSSNLFTLLLYYS